MYVFISPSLVLKGKGDGMSRRGMEEDRVEMANGSPEEKKRLAFGAAHEIFGAANG